MASFVPAPFLYKDRHELFHICIIKVTKQKQRFHAISTIQHNSINIRSCTSSHGFMSILTSQNH